MLKAWDFSKKNSATDALILICRKIFRANILENGTGQMLLIVVLMVGLWLKFQMKIVDKHSETIEYVKN